jgi:hypothetical protein
MIGEVYRATLLEKQEKKYEQAKIRFNRAIELSSEIPIKTEHYICLSYCGLARIS